MDNLEEMDKFVEKYNFPKLNQEEIEDLNKPITSKEIQTVIRNLPAFSSYNAVFTTLTKVTIIFYLDYYLLLYHFSLLIYSIVGLVF